MVMYGEEIEKTRRKREKEEREEKEFDVVVLLFFYCCCCRLLLPSFFLFFIAIGRSFMSCLLRFFLTNDTKKKRGRRFHFCHRATATNFDISKLFFPLSLFSSLFFSLSSLRFSPSPSSSAIFWRISFFFLYYFLLFSILLQTE